MQILKTSLSSAQLLALAATPVQIVAAPGAGNVILPLSIILRSNFNTAAYAAGSQVNLYIGSKANGLLLPVCAATFVQSVATRVQLTPLTAFAAVLDVSANIVNQALYLSAVGAEFTTGDGTLDVYLAYDPWRL